MVLESEAVETSADEGWSKLAIGGIDCQESATHQALGSTAFVDIDMSSLGTYHRLVRAAHKVNVQHIGTSAVENEIDFGLRAEMLTERLFRTCAPLVIAIGESMVGICICNCLQNLGANTRMVITTKSPFHLSIV